MNEVKPSSKVQVGNAKGKSEMNGASSQLNESQVSVNWKKLLQEHPEQVSASRSDTNFPNKPRPKRSRPKKTQNKNPEQLLEYTDHVSTAQNKQKFSNQPRRKMAPQKNIESKKQLDIWFDDVDESLIEPIAALASSGKYPALSSAKSLVAPSGITGITQHVAIDCEMVGAGKDGEDDILARVSIVNQFGHCLYDKYVKPREKVTDYRTRFSGIRPANLKNAEEFDVVQKEVADIIKGKILVGHALHNDMKVLFLSHPRQRIRDTSRYKPFRKMTGCGGIPSLKRLTEKLLGVNVQQGSHDSIEDAQAAMKLYIMHKIQWEASLKRKKSN